MEVLQPKTRFPEFNVNSSQYQKHLFKDIFDFSTGKNIKQKEASPEFENPCVRYGELYHMYNEVITKVINSTNLDKSELVFSDGNEILLPSAGEDPLDIGSASALTVKNVAIGRTINILKPLKDNIYNQIYASYYINHKLRKKISSLAKGVSISNVYNSDLKTLEIILPSLLEQNKLAKFLLSVDEKLNLLKEKKILLEEFKKGIIQKIFNQELRFKNDDGNDYVNWDEKCLGDILIKNSRKNKNLIVTYVESISNKFGFVSQDDFFDSNNIASKNLSNYYVIENGFFAYNPSRINVGSLAYKNDNKTSVISPLYISFKTKNEVNDIFLLNYFDTLNFVNQMNASFEGSVRNTLSYESLIKIKISLPCRQEQTKIAIFLSAIDKKIDLVSNQIQDNQEYKIGLLQQMFI